MTAFLLPLLAGLLRCKLCWVAVGIGAAVLLLWGYVAHVKSTAYSAGYAARDVEVQAATAAESARWDRELAESQFYGNQIAAVAAEKDRANAELLAKINDLSRRHDRECGWGIDASRRLRTLSAGSSRK